jgi:hypothetical protein
MAHAEEIQPDRPEVTESANLVPKGSVQLETGLVFASQRAAASPTQRTFGIEADLRIGLGRNFEVDIEGDPFVRVRGPADDTGFGDITLGVRYRFIEAVEDQAWPPSVAMKPFVKLPIAGEPIGSGRPDFGLLLMASFSLPLEFEVEVNAGAAAIGQSGSGGFRAQALASAAVSREIVHGLLAFLELLYRSREQADEGQQLSVNAGLIYRITPTIAVDGGVQASLLGQAPDYVIRTGLSVLWGR